MSDSETLIKELVESIEQVTGDKKSAATVKNYLDLIEMAIIIEYRSKIVDAILKTEL